MDRKLRENPITYKLFGRNTRQGKGPPSFPLLPFCTVQIIGEEDKLNIQEALRLNLRAGKTHASFSMESI